MVIEDWAVVIGLIGVILTVIGALITGVCSIKIFKLKKEENEKRDNAQIKRDNAHTDNLKNQNELAIANLMYKRCEVETEKKREDKIREEVDLYNKILGKVKTEVKT